MFSPSASKWVTVPYDIAAGVGTVYDRDLILAVSGVGAGGTLCAGLQSPTEMTVCNRAGRTALPDFLPPPGGGASSALTWFRVCTRPALSAHTSLQSLLFPPEHILLGFAVESVHFMA